MYQKDFSVSWDLPPIPVLGMSFLCNTTFMTEPTQ